MLCYLFQRCPLQAYLYNMKTRCSINIVVFKTSGLYYKPITIINDNSGVINKLETSLTDHSRVFIYNRHIFIVQGTVHLSYPLTSILP